MLINGTGNISPSVNGTRTTSTSLFFNGIDATNLTSNEGSLNDNVSPASDTLQEVKLQTSLYDASTGRSGGGNFQLVTRSGTKCVSRRRVLQLPARDHERERLLLREGRYRQAEGAPQRRRLHAWRAVRQNRIFFFGGYERTQAETGFVPTASSISALPQALQLIQGARTKENLSDAFSALNPVHDSHSESQCASPTDRACISDVALKLLNLRNPVTGDFVIPARGPTPR